MPSPETRKCAEAKIPPRASATVAVNVRLSGSTPTLYHDLERDSYLDEMRAGIEQAVASPAFEVEHAAIDVCHRMTDAALTASRFIPLNPIDDAALASGLRQLSMPHDGNSAIAVDPIDMRVIAMLTSSRVPTLKNVDPELIVTVRQEVGFAEWRRPLRRSVLTVRHLTAAERNQAIADELHLAVDGVRSGVSRSRALRDAFKDEWMKTVIEVPFWTGVSAALPAGRFLSAGRVAGGVAAVLTKALTAWAPEEAPL